MYYINIICLENCYYSDRAKQLLKKKNIKHKIVSINYKEKNKYKTKEISTFPQIYLKKEFSHGSLLLGGLDDLTQALNILKNKNIPNITLKFQKLYPLWSKKAIYRFIELVKK